VKSTLWKITKLALLATVLWFVGRAVARDLARVDDWSAFRPEWVFVLLAGVALLGVSVVQMLSYRALLGGFGTRLDWGAMAGVAWVPPLGKYVPGKIWALGGAMAMLRTRGVSAAIAVTCVLMVDALAVLSGLIVGAPVALKPAVAQWIPGAGWTVAAVVTVGLVMLHPGVFARALNALLKRLGKPALAQTPTMRQMALPMVCAFSQWAFAGAALWCVTRSLTDVPIAAMPGFVPLAACAMTISYLALIAPGGIGVREAIYLALLPQLVIGAPAGTVALVVVAMRLWQTVIEVGLAGLGYGLWRRQSGKSDVTERRM
jgi:glycosyltransferase 2 family protein